MKRDPPCTPLTPNPCPPTHTCHRGRGGQLGEVKASRGQMAVDWQPVHLASRLAQPGYLFIYLTIFIYSFILWFWDNGGADRHFCQYCLFGSSQWHQPGQCSLKEVTSVRLAGVHQSAPIRTDVHTLNSTTGQVFASRPTLPLLTPAESLEGESPHW